MAYTEALLRSCSRLLSSFDPLAAVLLSRQSLYTNYPIEMVTSKSGRPTLQSRGYIQKDRDILLLSAGEGMFSTGLSGASQSQQEHLLEELKDLGAKYDAMTPEFMERTKLFLQVMAHSQQLKEGEMPLKSFANYLQSQSLPSLLISDFNSRFLLALYQSLQSAQEATFQFLKDRVLKRTSIEQYTDLCQRVRPLIRSAGDSPYRFLAPIFDRLDHSNTPNCQFNLLYLPHRRAPYLRLRTLLPIEASSRLTLSYGALNNYELLLGHGFTLPNNSYSIFMLPLDYFRIVQIFGKNVEWKQKMLTDRSLKLKGHIRILPSGKLHPQDLIMLRILVNDRQNPQAKDLSSQALDPLLYDFVRSQAAPLRQHLRINSLRTSEKPQIRRLQLQQELFLDRLLGV